MDLHPCLIPQCRESLDSLGKCLLPRMLEDVELTNVGTPDVNAVKASLVPTMYDHIVYLSVRASVERQMELASINENNIMK